MTISCYARRWLLGAGLACSLGLVLIYCGRITAQNAEGQNPAPRPEPSATGVSENGRAANASTDSETAKDMEKRFGTKSVQVPGGPLRVIFIEGRYIDAPYHLTRRGLTIYVNGIEVERLAWPSPYYIAEDPPLPEGLNADSRRADITPWMSRKWCYYHSHFPSAEAIQKSIDAYRALPCVKRVELQLPGGDTLFTNLQVELRSGEVCDWVVEDVDLRPQPEERVRLLLEASMEHWEGMLRGDRSLLYHARWGQVLTAERPTWTGLPEIVAILKTDWPMAKKAAALQPFFSHHFADAEQLRLFLKPLLTDFQGSPQLDARVEMIRKEREEAAKEN